MLLRESNGPVVEWEGALRLDRRVEDLSIKLTRHRRDELAELDSNVGSNTSIMQYSWSDQQIMNMSWDPVPSVGVGL